jgi:CheY-like chemotaxis protein
MNLKPLKVWLVDDDASIRWVLEKALKGSGMQAKCFDQADNVITALRADVPDVLMTDIRMPGRSGLDLLKEIQGSRPGLPVIVMTAHSDLDAAVAAYQGGAFEYLQAFRYRQSGRSGAPRSKRPCLSIRKPPAAAFRNCWGKPQPCSKCSAPSADYPAPA